MWFEFKDNDKNNDKNIQLIGCLHKILRPFLLRRAKKDLAVQLPDKVEIIVNVNMSPMQFDIYEKLLKSQNIFAEKNKQNNRQLNNLLMQVTCRLIMLLVEESLQSSLYI